MAGLMVHEGGVTSVAFSPDDGFINDQPVRHHVIACHADELTMSTAGPEAGRRGPCRNGRWSRRTVLISLATAVLLALFYVEENWRGHRMWQAYKQNQS